MGIRTVNRYNETKSKIEKYKEKVRRGHTRSLTPAITIDPPASPHSIHSVDLNDKTTVYGHESFDRSSSNRFQRFKETAGKEIKRRSRQPAEAGAKEEEAEAGEVPKKGKKVKKGRRGRSKEEDEEPVDKKRKKREEVPEAASSAPLTPK